MQMILTVLQILLSLDLFLAGILKLFHSDVILRHWPAYDYPPSFLYVIALIEILTALGLFIGMWFSVLAIISSILVLILMLGAIYTHFIRARQPITFNIHAMILFLIALFVLFVHL